MPSSPAPIPLPDAALQALQTHASQGRAAWAAGDLPQAEAEFLAAWALIPEPKPAHDYAQSMASGLVAFFMQTRQFDKAALWLDRMREAYGPGPDASEADFIGAALAYETGDLDTAFQGFQALYKRFKRRPFQDEDPKYLKFYLQRAGGASKP